MNNDVDKQLELAAFIREIDGNNSLGASRLAEKIIEWQATRAAQDVGSKRIGFVSADGIRSLTSGDKTAGHAMITPVPDPHSHTPVYVQPPVPAIPPRLVELAHDEVADAAASAQEGGDFEPCLWATLVLKMVEDQRK